MTLREARCQFTLLIPLLISKAVELGYEIALDEGMNHQGVGHMKDSLHYSGCAQDIILYLKTIYIDDDTGHKDLGPYWESLHPFCKWGGRFGDYNHYSFSPPELFGNKKLRRDYEEEGS
jgi:hypothetical protein